MNSIYFKKRKNFDFKPHKYDLGIPFWPKNSHLDMHFLNKINELKDSEHENLYDYHKNHYLTSSSEAKKEVFFEEVFILLDSQIKKELLKEPLKMNSKSKTKWEKRIQKYKSFLGFLKDKEEWDFINPENETQKIKELKEEIKELKSELKKFTVKNEHKIDIIDEDIDILIDIFHQIQNLTHWKPGKSNELLISYSQNTWAKIISNYFTLRSKDLPFDTMKKKFNSDSVGKFHNKRKYEIKIKAES